jgi:hypothetical protein
MPFDGLYIAPPAGAVKQYSGAVTGLAEFHPSGFFERWKGSSLQMAKL